MRICQVCSGYSVDDHRVFHRACTALVAAGYEVHLIAVSKKAGTYRDRGVTIHPLPECRSRRQRMARCSRIARMAADLRPALFHVYEPALLGPVIARAGSRPVVYDVRESFLDVLMDREWIPRWLRPAARFAWDRRERQLVRRCAGVVVVTERVAVRYCRMHENVRVVANYPELTACSDLSRVSRVGNQCVFGGTLLPNRGLSQLFEALAILKRRGLPIPLALAGPAGSEEYLHALWREADRLGIRGLVTYHGVLSRSETLRLQDQSTIAVVPHLPIGNNLAAWPVKMLECMALGLPVVYSNLPNHHEIAGVSGAGIAVDPARPEQMADAIERLVGDPDLARQMGEAGRRAVRERFNWDAERLKLLDLYQSILEPIGHSESAEVRGASSSR